MLRKLMKKRSAGILLVLTISTSVVFSVFVVFVRNSTPNLFNVSDNYYNKHDDLGSKLQQLKQQPRFFLCSFRLPRAARLGNVLFVFGSLFGIARKFKGAVLLPEHYSRQLGKLFQLKSFISNLSPGLGLDNVIDYLKDKRHGSFNYNDADTICSNIWKRNILERWASGYDNLLIHFVSTKLASMACSGHTDAANKNIGCNDKEDKSSNVVGSDANDMNVTNPMMMTAGLLKTRPKVTYLEAELSKPIFGVGPYLQSFKYFDEYKEDLLKSEFKFHGWIERRAKRVIDYAYRIHIQKKNLKPTEDILTIGVHIRRTDMGLKNMMSRGYTMATSTYVEKAIEFYNSKFSNQFLLFIVATDDLEWSKKYVRSSRHTVVFTADLIASQLNSNNNNYNIYNNQNSDENHNNFNNTKEAADIKEESLKMKMFDATTLATTLDLAILSSTDHSIITVGSYGWWGAYLSLKAGRQVLYYAAYPLSESEIANTFIAQDYYPPHWIGLS